MNNDRSGLAEACTVTLNIAGDYVAKGSTNDAVAMDISVSGTSEGVVYLSKGYTGTGRVAIWNAARTATISQVNVSACPIRLWVQGTTASSAVPDVTVTATLKVGGVTKDTDSDTVTVVKVNKVQYQSGENWVDISGTLYVSKGSTVTFKAVPAPAAASWPSGKPVWGGTAGATGTGTTKEVTFNTASTNTTDFKTVTAECGNTITVNVIVVQVDLDMDSDNDNGTSAPDRSIAEDMIEDKTGDSTKPGKFIETNYSDNDNDGIPDFADGYDLDGAGGNADDTCSGESFLPLVLEIPVPINIASAKVRFTYSASDPASVSRTGANPLYKWEPPGSGHVRIWTKNGSSARNKRDVSSGGDYVSSGTSYNATDLGFSGATRTVTFYVEGIVAGATYADKQIMVEMDPTGVAGWITADAVRTTVATVDIDIDSDNNGTIDLYDDSIEDKDPGCVIPKDEYGVVDSRDVLKPINLSVAPTLPGSKIMLCTNAGGIKIWTNSDKTGEVTLPAIYTSDNLPATLYVDGVTIGSSVDGLATGSRPDICLKYYEDSSKIDIGLDKVKVLVTETISWSPGKGDAAKVWYSHTPLGNDDGEAFEDELEDPHSQGFDVQWYQDLNSNDATFAGCTLEHYKALKDQAAFCVISHGGKGAHWAVCASNDDAGKQACYDWIFATTLGGDDSFDNEEYITTGLNGICNTTAVNPDNQLIPPNEGLPNTTAITAGTNGVLDTTPSGDDKIYGITITSGTDGVCNTTAAGDDVPVIPVNQGKPNQNCIRTGEVGMTVKSINDFSGTYWSVRVSSGWLASNFAPTLNTNKAITFWNICYSAQGSETEAPVKEAAGGRWRIGYWEPTDELEAKAVSDKFLMRMNGETDSSEKRTAGKAWGAGVGYYTTLHGEVNVRMHGNDWTTLCPSPMKDNAVWPDSSPGNRYGWGCIIFDTFMNHELSASNALVKVSGCPTYDHRWVGDSANSRYFILGFDYDKTGGAATEMKAEADHCKNRDPNDATGARKLDGNRKWNNGDDKNWPW